MKRVKSAIRTMIWLEEPAMRLRRTLHRGIYRRASVFVVPCSDELGIEHFREFATLREAREYRKTFGVEIGAGNVGGGAPHDFGVAQANTLKDWRPF